MKSYVTSLTLLFVASTPLFAQKTGDPINLTIHPANVPQPSLKYRLFPDRSELTNGNAPTQYYRALSLFVENQGLLGELRDDYWEKWLNMPLKDLPRKEVAEKVHMARYLIRELEIGSKRKQCDWQLEDRQEGIFLLLPEVQGFRNMARPLAVRARLYIAEGKYTEACETLQIGYALAQHMGQGPTLIHVVVGMAIARIMTDQVETLLQQPDAPNLYWSLTVLPKPFADLRPVLEQEAFLLETMFPWIKQLDTTPLSEERVKAIQEKLANANRDLKARQPNASERARQALTLTRTVAEGKRELVARYQFTKEQVAAMPSFQVAALFAYRDYKEAGAEVVKWSHVPEGWKYPEYTTAQKRYDTAEARLVDIAVPGLLDGFGKLGDSQTSPLEAMSMGAVRTDRRFAALRCIEALRQYAVKHEGKLPAALADVKELPIPSDPLTGKPFEYALDGDKATLMLAKPAEEKPNPNKLLIYHVTMKRGKD